MHDRYCQREPSHNLSEAIAAPPLTALAAEALIDQLPLTPERRRDLKSDLNCVVKIARLPASNVLLSPPFLRECWLNGFATGFGFSERRNRNLRSSIRFILRAAGAMDPKEVALLPAWAEVLALPGLHERDALGPVAKFASLRLIPPARFHDHALDYLTHLVERTLAPKPRNLFGRMRLVWNRCCATIEGWPGQPIAQLGSRNAYVRPPAEFPESFRRDLARFGNRLTASLLADDDHDLLTAEGEDESLACPAPLRATSAALRQDHARWAASALVATGLPVAAVTSLASLVVPTERVRTILRFLFDRADKKASAAGMHVGEVLMMIARYHVRLPESEIAKIQRWGKPVRLHYRRMTEKNEARVRAAMLPYHENRLRELPDAFIATAHKLLAEAPLQAVSLAMRGTAVDFLQRRPLRLGNLCGLRLDSHLKHDDPRDGRITRILIPAEETKNNREINVPVPRPLANRLDEWIRVFRPIIAAPGCVYLFPGHGTGNRPFTPQGMRDAVKSATRQHVGVELSPHQFRHLTACVFLDENPGQYEPVRQLLGHATSETAARHYAGIEDEATNHRWDDVVLERRQRRRNQQMAPAPKRRSGKPRKGRG